MVNATRTLVGSLLVLLAAASVAAISALLAKPAMAAAPLPNGCQCEAVGQWSGIGAGGCSCDATLDTVVNTDGLCLPEPFCSPSTQCKTEATVSWGTPGGFPPPDCSGDSVDLTVKAPCNGDGHVTARCDGGSASYTLSLFCQLCTPQ